MAWQGKNTHCMRNTNSVSNTKASRRTRCWATFAWPVGASAARRFCTDTSAGMQREAARPRNHARWSSNLSSWTSATNACHIAPGRGVGAGRAEAASPERWVEWTRAGVHFVLLVLFVLFVDRISESPRWLTDRRTLLTLNTTNAREQMVTKSWTPAAHKCFPSGGCRSRQKKAILCGAHRES